MATIKDSDQQLQQQPKRTGYRKKDLSKKEAELAVTLRNLKERRDRVVVTLPTEKDEPLIVKINDVVFLEKVLPGAIIFKKCKTKIKYGEKGEVKITLRKEVPEDWMHRWSPSRDLGPNDGTPSHSLDQSRSSSSQGLQSHSTPASRAMRSPSSSSSGGNSNGPVISMLE